MQLPRLQYLDLYGTGLTDAGLARLSRLTLAAYCYLSHTPDHGRRHRAPAPADRAGGAGTRRHAGNRPGAGRPALPANLRRLRIGRTRVTDAGLAHVAGLPEPQRLELDDLPVTDAGVATLQRCPGSSRWTSPAPASPTTRWPTLARLPALAELDVRDTAVTAEAVAAFRQAHPGVSVTSGVTPVRLLGLVDRPSPSFTGSRSCAICFYGLHRYWLAWLFLRDRQARTSPEPKGRFTELPAVTVQLPMFNERHVAERIIEAACALDYPRDRLQIQVLDDSTDESADIARRCCERLAAAGHPVEYLHRPGARRLQGRRPGGRAGDGDG